MASENKIFKGPGRYDLLVGGFAEGRCIRFELSLDGFGPFRHSPLAGHIALLEKLNNNGSQDRQGGSFFQDRLLHDEAEPWDVYRFVAVMRGPSSGDKPVWVTGVYNVVTRGGTIRPLRKRP